MHRRLNEAFCVDATRSGNMAHLLNHSCDPNCYSRTVNIRLYPSDAPVEHVIIFAKVGRSVGNMSSSSPM